MAFDSSIRLKQLNQSELSGFVVGLINSFAPNNTTGNIIPGLSGVYNLGSTVDYYNELYTNIINIPQNSGIYFGNNFFTAYSSGGVATISINGYTISSSGTFISIQGPQGIQGPSGNTGMTGATGISVTGAFWSGSSSGIIFQLSNNTNLPLIYFPAFTGASGTSTTGFFQSGNLIFPQFNNKTGNPIILPSGIQGPMGLPGTVILNYISGDSPFSQVNFPSTPYISNYYTAQPFPPLSFMRGMSYAITLSGLNTHYLTPLELALITGIFSGIPNVGLTTSSSTAYYADPKNTTGYWRFAFFPTGTPTGIYSGEHFSPSTSTSPPPNESTDIPTSVDIYRSLTTFNVPFTAQNNYNYGFSLYGAGDTSVASGANNTIATGFAIVCGNVVISSGVGPQGIQGNQGTPGNIGPVGPQGLNGNTLPGVTGVVNVGGTGIYFLLVNDGTTNTIAIPTGGPPGGSGQQGPPGSLTNYFEGVYVNTTTYSQNDTVSRFGSTYIYTGNMPSSGNPPESGLDWQLLAASGTVGQIGPTGTTISYYNNFFVVSGMPTGAGNFVNKITGISVNGISLSGTGAQFTTGQVVSFINSGLIGLAYSPYQQILVSTNSQTGTYFNATINSYSPSNGELSFTVFTGTSNLTGIPGTTISGTEILWYNYNNATINLFTNTVVLTGFQGIQGPSGQASLLRQSGQIIVGTGAYLTGSNALDPINTDCFNIIVTGDNSFTYGGYPVSIDFNWADFPVGKSVLLKIANSGANFTAEPNLVNFVGNSVNIQWPNNVVTFPNNGQVYIYTILRFMNTPNGNTGCFGTYSNPYTFIP